MFGDGDPALVAAACVALRTCTTFDDLRKDFAGAFDAAKDAVKVRRVSRGGTLLLSLSRSILWQVGPFFGLYRKKSKNLKYAVIFLVFFLALVC